MPHMGEIMILTGPPGSGKTTVATGLAARAGEPKVHLHADDFWRFIRNGAIAPYLPEAHHQNGIVMGALAAAADGYAAGGYFVIVDGIVGPWFLDPFLALTRPVHYIILAPPLQQAVDRCVARGGEELSDPAVIEALYDRLLEPSPYDGHRLTCGDDTPEALAMRIVAARDSGAYLLPS